MLNTTPEQKLDLTAIWVVSGFKCLILAVASGKSTDMSVSGYIAQRGKNTLIETNLHSPNHNTLDSMRNLQWNVIITALTEGAIDFVCFL